MGTEDPKNKPKSKPTLTLVSTAPNELDAVAKLYEAISGRKPTTDEMAEAKKALKD